MGFSKLVRDLPVTDLRKRAFQERMEEDNNFMKAFFIDVTEEFMVEAVERKIREGNTILEFYAKGRSGKTYSAMKMAKALDPDFSIDKLFFEQEELLKAAPSIQPGSCLVLDEKKRDYGEGSARREAEYENLIQVCGKYRLSINNCSVVPRLKEGLAHYELEPLYIDYDNEREVICAVYYPELIGRFFDLHCIGFARFGHPDTVLGKEAVAEYERRKDMFLESVRTRGYVDPEREIVEQTRRHPDYSLKLWAAGKEGKLPTKDSMLEIVNKVRPDLRRNNEAKRAVEVLLDELRLEVLRKQKEAAGLANGDGAVCGSAPRQGAGHEEDERKKEDRNSKEVKPAEPAETLGG